MMTKFLHFPLPRVAALDGGQTLVASPHLGFPLLE